MVVDVWRSKSVIWGAFRINDTLPCCLLLWVRVAVLLCDTTNVAWGVVSPFINVCVVFFRLDSQVDSRATSKSKVVEVNACRSELSG